MNGPVLENSDGRSQQPLVACFESAAVFLNFYLRGFQRSREDLINRHNAARHCATFWCTSIHKSRHAAACQAKFKRRELATQRLCVILHKPFGATHKPTVDPCVKLSDLSFNLDRLFNTDEIGTFKIRDLPNHPVTNKRQIALDFMSSFDAMAAHEKLEGYHYEMEDGRQYTLRAKINKAEEYMCESQTPEPCSNSSWHGADWQTLALVPSLDGEMYHRANARLDAQLYLLKKQQLIIEKEKEILKEKRLKRKYGSTHTYDDSDSSSSKRSRSRSREHRSSSRHRSRSKKSKGRGYKFPQIEWPDEKRAKSSGHRSRSKDRKRSHEKRTRNQRSGSQESGDSRYGSRQRSGSKERGSSRDTIQSDRQSGSKERVHREGSKEQMMRSKEHGNKDKKSSREKNLRELRSMSRERMGRSKERSRSRERRSRSKVRSRTHRRSSSRERAHRYRRRTSKERDYRVHRSRSKEPTTLLRERSLSRQRMRGSHEQRSTYRRSRSRSREHMRSSHEQRSRSRSRERMRSSHEQRSRSRSRERTRSYREQRSTYRRPRSRSKERMRSSHEQRSTYQRSRSRDLTFHSNDRTMRSRSSERRPNPLAIMPKSPKGLKSPMRTIEDTYYEDDCSFIDNIKRNTGVQSEKVLVKAEKRDVNTGKKVAAVTNENKTYNLMDDKSKKPKSKEEKGIAKFNSKIKKTEMIESRVKEFTKDVMVLIIILLEELMNKDKVRISAFRKMLLTKKLETLVAERVEPLARKKKSTDVEVLRKYKKLYPREVELVMIKQMLDKIPKIRVDSQSTVTGSSEDFTPHIPEPVTLTVEDIEELKDYKNNLSPSENLIPCESRNENIEQETIIIDSGDEHSSPTIKKEIIEEKPVIIDLDSAEKTIPRHPQFVVVIKTLIKKMKKVGLDQLLQTNYLKIRHFSHVLRHILRQMLKGQGYTPRKDIISKFREMHPEDKDEEFVKNVIKDIRCGKYPRCMDSIDIITEDNGSEDPEAVVFVEKQHDIVTVADSDDDDENKPIMEDIDHESVRRRDMPELSSSGENSSPNKVSQAAYADPSHIAIDSAKLIASHDETTTDGTNLSNCANPTKLKTKKNEKEMKRADVVQSGVVESIDEDNGSEDPEAVVFVEKQHDIVTVADSDDDDENKPIMEDIDHESVRRRDMPELSSSGENSSPNKVSQAAYADPSHIAVDFAKSIASHDETTTDGTNLSNCANPTKLKTKKNEKEMKRADVVQSGVVESIDGQETQAVSDFGDDDSTQVTAITIMTSLDDLLAKTANTRESETEPIKDLKEELEYVEDKPDNSSLQLVPDSGPIVTSITIMTSDAELFSIGQEDDHKEVSEVKEEEDTYYDAEETLLNELEKDINNDKFSLQMNKEYDNYNLQTVLQDENHSLSNYELISDKTDQTQDSKNKDEDETIECIGRYVASLF